MIIPILIGTFATLTIYSCMIRRIRNNYSKNVKINEMITDEDNEYISNNDDNSDDDYTIDGDGDIVYNLRSRVVYSQFSNDNELN